MARYIWDAKSEKVIPAEDYYNNRYLEKAHLQMTKGNQLVVMNFISDTMDSTRHMADGKYYTSKKAFRDATRRAGCIEIGNETKYLTKPRKEVKLDKKTRRDSIKKAINDLKWGNVPRTA